MQLLEGQGISWPLAGSQQLEVHGWFTRPLNLNLPCSFVHSLCAEGDHVGQSVTWHEAGTCKWTQLLIDNAGSERAGLKCRFCAYSQRPQAE